MKSPLPARGALLATLTFMGGLHPLAYFRYAPTFQAEAPHSYDSTKKPPRSALKSKTSESTSAQKRRARFSDDVEKRELEDLGYASPHASRPAITAGFEGHGADVDSVLGRAGGTQRRLLPLAARVRADPSMHVRRALRHKRRRRRYLDWYLICRMKSHELAKAARVLTEVLKRCTTRGAHHGPDGRSTARGLCQALKTADRPRGALRDAIANFCLTPNGGREASVQRRALATDLFHFYFRLIRGRPRPVRAWASYRTTSAGRGRVVGAGLSLQFGALGDDEKTTMR